MTRDHQHGLKKPGYEICIHYARYIAKKIVQSGLVILLLDLENTFNRVDRALLLDLVIGLMPEAARVLCWLYEKETADDARRR